MATSTNNSTQNTSNTSTAPSHISLEMAERMLVKYDGDKSKLHEFIDNCSMAMSLVQNTHKSILFKIILSKITDRARILIKNRNFETWASLKEYLLEGYSDRRTQGQWQLELHSCKQNPNEDVISFANKVENCYVKLLGSLDHTVSDEKREGYAELLQGQALSVFLMGLNRDISLIVKSRNPETLEDAIQLALNEEREIKSLREISKYQNVNSNFTRHCTFCNKNGHTSFNCRNKPQTRTYSQNRFTQNQNDNQRQNTNYNFNHVRHVETNNPNNQGKKICNYCKNIGHLIHECRKRQYNNNLKRNRDTTNPNSNLGNRNQSNPERNNSLNSSVPRRN